MDWKLERSTGVVIKRDDGLDIQFQGTENVTRVGLSQRVAILPGRYRLAAHLLAEDITTDEGVYWQVYDAENSIRLSVTGKPIRGTLDKSWMYLDFTAPRGTRAVEVAMYRRPSLRFDNKLGGRLHLFEVSLTRSSAGEE